MFSNFLIPSAFIWLLVIPFVILLYFLKLKREEYIFPSTMLWQKVINDMRVNSPFQKIRNNLLLYLQILLLLLIIFALSRPFLAQQALQGRNIIVLLDISASMNATDENDQTRLQEAQGKILDIINDLNTDDRMMIITFGSNAKIVQTFTHLKRKLEDSISTIKVEHTNTHFIEALDIARAMFNVEGTVSPSIYIFTDGRIEDLENILTKHAQQKNAVVPQIVICGKSGDNVAIVSLDVKKSPLKQSQQVFVQVQNFSLDRTEVLVELLVNGKLLLEDVRLLDMGGGDVRGILFEDIRIESGVIEAKITVRKGHDYLDTDNSAWFVLPPEQNNKICLVGGGNFLLRKVLLSHDANLKEMTLSEYEGLFSTEDGQTFLKKYDLIVFDSANPKNVLSGIGNVFFNCIPQNEEIVNSGELTNEYGFRVVDQSSLHPTMRFVDMRKFAFGKVLDLSWPEDTTPLLEIEDHIAIGSISRQNKHFLIIGVDIFHSSWPMHISFPIFVANTISWFKETFNRQNIKTNDIAHVQFSQNIIKAKIITSKNEEKLQEDLKTNLVRLSDTKYVGICEIMGYDDLNDVVENHKIAINLFSLNESKIEPIKELNIEEKNIAARDLLSINKEIWHYLVFIAFFILFLEWFVFHKRSLSLSVFKKKKPLSFETFRK